MIGPPRSDPKFEPTECEGLRLWPISDQKRPLSCCFLGVDISGMPTAPDGRRLRRPWSKADIGWDGETETGCSVSSISPADWKKRQVQAFGGPGLHPDDGEIEVARGKENGIEWLLQTYTYPLKPGKIGQTGPDSSGLLGEASITPAPCLKLSNMEWACANPQGGGQNGSFGVWNHSAPTFDKVGLPPFAVVTTSLSAAASVRMTVGDSTSEAALSKVPGGNWDTARVAVLFSDLPAGSLVPSCVTDLPQAPQGVAPARIDLLDASGTPIGCLG